MWLVIGWLFYSAMGATMMHDAVASKPLFKVENSTEVVAVLTDEQLAERNAAEVHAAIVVDPYRS